MIIAIHKQRNETVVAVYELVFLKHGGEILLRSFL